MKFSLGDKEKTQSSFPGVNMTALFSKLEGQAGHPGENSSHFIRPWGIPLGHKARKTILFRCLRLLFTMTVPGFGESEDQLQWVNGLKLLEAIAWG